mmetsp:Transcript_49615/g.91565  ORF Transcript_49615/g.91565 Transcript_49615/m.91565 type:complete len:783 (+) Transcript_49615:31-2379(+)
MVKGVKSSVAGGSIAQQLQGIATPARREGGPSGGNTPSKLLQQEMPPKKRKAADAPAAGGQETKATKAAKKGGEEQVPSGETPEPAAIAATGNVVSSDTGPASLWQVTGKPDPTKLSSPNFDPSLREKDFPRGKPVPFGAVSDALKEIEDLKGSGKGSRKTMTVVLTNLFRILQYSRPEDLGATIYILCNKVAPDYEQAELGVGDGILVKTMCEVFGRSEAHMKNMLASGEAKDLGEVALMSRVSQKMLMRPPALTIEKLFSELKSIANSSGKDSQKVKKEKIQKMLVASRGEEAKYIARMLQAKLRIGIQIPTVLQAIAYAFVLTPPAGSGPNCGAKDKVVADIRKDKKKSSGWENSMVAMEASVRQAFSEMPNWDKLIWALQAGHDASTLATTCHISLGVPVKPMLAKPSKGLGEVAERLGGKRFTGEWKYDGERAQIHVVSKDNILIYSRNSENMTEKYPDVIQVVKDTLRPEVSSCIIDSELVAYDQVNQKILPFQILSTRGRKNISIEDIKVNVCIYAFDCMLHNDRPLVKETLESRREQLLQLLQETPGKVQFATRKNFEDFTEEEVQTFLDEAIAGSCEGLMLKTLSENATYEPSKRSLNWLKLKKDYLDGTGDSIDVVPIGAFYGKGKRTGAYGAFLLAVYDPESEEYQTVCKAGTGFSDEDLSAHHAFFSSRTRPNAEANYNVTDRLTPDVWLEACQVWEIKAADLSISPVHTAAIGIKADGKGIGLRFPRFLRIREDKSPEDSTGPDQIVEMFEAQASVGKDGGAAMGDDDF